MHNVGLHKSHDLLQFLVFVEIFNVKCQKDLVKIKCSSYVAVVVIYLHEKSNMNINQYEKNRNTSCKQGPPGSQNLRRGRLKVGPGRTGQRPGPL